MYKLTIYRRFNWNINKKSKKFIKNIKKIPHIYIEGKFLTKL